MLNNLAGGRTREPETLLPHRRVSRTSAYIYRLVHLHADASWEKKDHPIKSSRHCFSRSPQCERLFYFP